MSVRAVAARVLQQVIYGGESLTEALQQPAVQQVVPQDQALLRDLCFGSLRWHERISAILAQLLSKPMKAADKDVECLLRIGLYQMIYQRTPDHAAVNETVKAVKKLRKQWAEKLVNGVLRSFLREQESVLARIDQQDTARYAVPAWLLARIRAAWPDEWQNVLTASNAHAPMTLRVNQQHGTTAAYLAELRAVGIEAETLAAVPTALMLHKAVGV